MKPSTSSEQPTGVPIIGLLGGVASGKSAVASCFARLGCAVLDGDQLGHQVLADPEVIEIARARWGPDVTHEGQLDRRAIAARVFGTDPECAEQLAFWESIMHPRIGQLMSERIATLRLTHPGVVVDAAVMMKAGWQKQCDFLVFVEAPWEVRLERALARGWSAEQLGQREAAQASIEEKRNLADFVIDNSGDLQQTYEQVVKVWHAFSR